MKILTKAEFFRLWTAGVLGNKLKTWPGTREGLSEFLASGHSAVVGIRYAATGGGGGRCDYNVEPREVPARLREWSLAGLDPNRATICESAPDEFATIQGEVARPFDFLEGFIGLVKNGKRMRDSIRDGDLQPCRGVQVVDLLNRFMDASSRDDLDALFELYPDATIEFTCYSCLVGNLPGRNSIIWEVRSY